MASTCNYIILQPQVTPSGQLVHFSNDENFGLSPIGVVILSLKCFRPVGVKLGNFSCTDYFLMLDNISCVHLKQSFCVRVSLWHCADMVLQIDFKTMAHRKRQYSCSS